MNFIKVQPHKTYHQHNDGDITCKYPIVKIINKNWKLGLRACWQTIVLLLRKQSMLCRFLSNWAETWNIQRLQGNSDVRQKHMFQALNQILLSLYKCKIKFVFQAKVTKLWAVLIFLRLMPWLHCICLGKPEGDSVDLMLITMIWYLITCNYSGRTSPALKIFII